MNWKSFGGSAKPQFVSFHMARSGCAQTLRVAVIMRMNSTRQSLAFSVKTGGIVVRPPLTGQIGSSRRGVVSPRLAGVARGGPSDETAHVHGEEAEIRDDHRVATSPQPNYAPKKIAEHHHREADTAFIT